MKEKTLQEWKKVRTAVAKIGNKPDWVIQTAEAMLGFVESRIEELSAEITDGNDATRLNKECEALFVKLDEHVRLAANATNEIERLTNQVIALEQIMWIREMFVLEPLLAFKAEVLLHRYLRENHVGQVRESDLHLMAANDLILRMFDTSGANTVKGLKNRRTASNPRKESVERPGYYWDDDGKLQEDKTRKEPLNLACTRKNAQALMELFERTRRTKRGAQTFAMIELGITDARTFHRLT